MTATGHCGYNQRRLGLKHDNYFSNGCWRWHFLLRSTQRLNSLHVHSYRAIDVTTFVSFNSRYNCIVFVCCCCFFKTSSMQSCCTCPRVPNSPQQVEATQAQLLKLTEPFTSVTKQSSRVQQAAKRGLHFAGLEENKSI